MHRADAALGAILDLLRDTGWTSGPLRLVVTSDHGEFLGDHDLLDHGRYLYEVNQRIPVLWQETGRTTTLPDELPGLAIHDLVLDGTTPAPGVTLTASWPDRFWSGHSGGKIGNELGVARWGADGSKLWWRAGRYYRIALATDPKEEHPTEVDGAGVPADLQQAVERARAMSAPVEAADLPEDLKDALRAVGYVE